MKADMEKGERKMSENIILQMMPEDEK